MSRQTNQRKAYTAEEKLSIVKEHLVGKKPVSELCERYRTVTVLKWQQALFDHGAPARWAQHRRLFLLADASNTAYRAGCLSQQPVAVCSCCAARAAS